MAASATPLAITVAIHRMLVLAAPVTAFFSEPFVLSAVIVTPPQPAGLMSVPTVCTLPASCVVELRRRIHTWRRNDA